MQHIFEIYFKITPNNILMVYRTEKGQTLKHFTSGSLGFNGFKKKTRLAFLNLCDKIKELNNKFVKIIKEKYLSFDSLALKIFIRGPFP